MNLAIDNLRKHKRHGTSEFDETVATRDGTGAIHELHHQDGPAKSLERKQLYARIMAALQELPEDQRQVILLRELEGLSYKEIAEQTGLGIGHVGYLLHHALKALGNELARTGLVP
jgi:RNA polymerase sigma-70 factor (ECF subfamily)